MTYKIDAEKIFLAHPYVKEILARLIAAGYQAVLVGGVVRDGVRELVEADCSFSPEEVDIAASALPTEIRRLFPDYSIVGVGEEFGVLVLGSPDGHTYEVATFRTEGEYSSGRWPRKVELVRSLEGDIERRDLTVNGLAATIDGEVIDLVGGIKDLVAHRIRAIGDPQVRFSEDYLRMLRTVRFACQINGEIEAITADAIQKNAAKITSISWERIRDELLRILRTDEAARGITLFDSYGLLGHILPELTSLKGVRQPEKYHPEGDVYVHTIAALRVADGFVQDPLVKLAILLHDIGKPCALKRNDGVNMGGHDAIGARMVRNIGRRLRFSRGEISRVDFLVRNHMRLADLPKMGRGKQVRFVSEGEVSGVEEPRDRFPLFFDLLQVLVADCEATAHRSSGWVPIFRETLEIIEHIDHVCDLRNARKLIDGNTLLKMGMKPGPGLGDVLEQLHDHILAGEITTTGEAIARARELRKTSRELGVEKQ